MTFTVLRALHDIIGEALDDIERVYQAHGQDPAANVDGGDRDSKLSANASSPPASPRSSYAYSSYSKVSGTGKSPGATFRHKASLSSGSLGMICKAYVSPPPSPCVTTVREQRFEHEMGARPRPTSAFFSAPEVPLPPTPGPVLDFPSLDAPFDATSPSETLTSHPAVMAAINRIISACGQMAATVQTPFLTICDSTMGYHLPSCMRIVEAAHVVEILREHGPPGMHVDRLSQLCSIDASKLAHILRLLATHHIFKEVSPDVFGLNRISSLIDSGKNVDQLVDYRNLGQPELKYQGTNGISAFVGLCSDEINKASSYMTETYLLSSSPRIREANQPTLAPFCLAFGAVDRNVDYFGWLEGQNDKQAHNSGTELGHGSEYSPAPGLPDPLRMSSSTSSNEDITHSGRAVAIPNLSRFRLERFGKAMSGTGSWEAPGAVFGGFNWRSLPRGSVIVDVGGGIGSTSMMLATTFSPPTGEDLGFKFVIQDRAVVVDMGEKAWKDKCPALLESGTARFQVHDFFTPQPIRDAAVFLLRVVMHDWPDDHARKILLHLREAATSQTKLLLADFVLPLACADDFSSDSANGLGLEEVEGAQRVLAPAPLLPNLGKASANVYWMDLTMNVMFNSRERTLREIVLLALSAGWKVVKVTQAPGSLFGYIVAVPVKVGGGGGGGSADEAPSRARGREDMEMAGKGDEVETRSKAELKCLAVADALAKFGGGVKRFRGPGTIGRGLGGSGKEG
ncbi:hypothetical protein DFP72DRAFT_442350 [Ephemerocybe angulata]|uniref:O-methyltransferase C-terminal domain-containing protein n=1 Tax=Ephemerocybe angulata TaxID=980116 RepID=A0A8H6HUI6_9AGAR|nr:hypothetical protein DFP72DRAFT_442350 [Tulosesus angulatus]